MCEFAVKFEVCNENIEQSECTISTENDICNENGDENHCNLSIDEEIYNSSSKTKEQFDKEQSSILELYKGSEKEVSPKVGNRCVYKEDNHGDRTNIEKTHVPNSCSERDISAHFVADNFLHEVSRYLQMRIVSS